jgi:hypothetical protein
VPTLRVVVRYANGVEAGAPRRVLTAEHATPGSGHRRIVLDIGMFPYGAASDRRAGAADHTGDLMHTGTGS